MKEALRRIALPIVRRLVGNEYYLLSYRGIVGEDTVCLASYPRSGNTALRLAMIQAIKHRRIEVEDIDRYSVDLYQTKSYRIRRILAKSHSVLKWHAYPATELALGKVIYVYRDPLSVCRSYYVYLAKRHERVEEDPATFVRQFLSNGIDSFGTWLSHFVVWRTFVEANGGLLVNFDDLINSSSSVFEEIESYVGWPNLLSKKHFIESISLERSLKSRSGVDFFKSARWASDFDAVVGEHSAAFRLLEKKAGFAK